MLDSYVLTEDICGRTLPTCYDVLLGMLNVVVFAPGFLSGVASALLVLHAKRVRSQPALLDPQSRTWSEKQEALLPLADNFDDFVANIANTEIVATDLELGPKLGQGTFGEVFKGRWKGAYVAVKIVHHGRSGASSNIVVAREKMFGTASVHPNVVPVYAVLTEDLRRSSQDGSANHHDGERDLRTNIIMELCDRGSLLKMRERFWGLLKEDRSKALLCIYKTLLEIVFGMEYLHSIEVVHGDLKCGNVLCFSKVNDPRGFSCKVCDFGLSRSKEGLAELYSSSFGTAVFASPELLSTGSVGFASDVYAFAMLAWHLLSMSSVVTALEDYQVIHQVCHNKWRPAIPDIAPDGLRCLMTACWSQDQKLRPTFTEIRKSLIDQFHSLP